MFETLVIGEIHKWISTMAEDVLMYFYRTRSKMEVDLLLEIPGGLFGIEIKNRQRVSRTDTRALRALAHSLGEQWLGGLVVYTGSELRMIHREESIWTMPVHRLI